MAAFPPLRPLLVVDAPEEVQRWVDALTESARENGPQWPAPVHRDLPVCVITVAQLWRTVQENFWFGEQRWSVAEHGLPRLVLADGSSYGSDIAPTEPAEPDSGSMWHNALHACLGNFH